MPEKNLQKLLASIKPELSDKQFQFCTVDETRLQELDTVAQNNKPIAVFREAEAVTLVIEQDAAQKLNLNGNGPWALITCSINSDLTAVGFLAAMTTLLAEHQISVNAFSAYYHDHLFVPADRADDAMQLLQNLSDESQS